MAVAKPEEQVFPRVKRVLYRKATLHEVVCQTRFPVDLRLEKDPPADFQQRVRATFPLLERNTQSIVGTLPTEVAKAFEAMGRPSGTTTVWQFATEDGKTQLELAKDNLTLISRSYDTWEHFWDQFRGSLDAFVELYEPPFFVRIGLRYKNLLRRSLLGLDKAPWNELLKGPVLGELAANEIREKALEATRNLLVTLPEREAKARLQHGFVQGEGSDEQCYLLDCDSFVERTEVDHAHDAIAYLHQHATRYFRWCITDRLHRAMEPDPIPT